MALSWQDPAAGGTRNPAADEGPTTGVGIGVEWRHCRGWVASTRSSSTACFCLCWRRMRRSRLGWTAPLYVNVLPDRTRRLASHFRTCLTLIPPPVARAASVTSSGYGWRILAAYHLSSRRTVAGSKLPAFLSAADRCRSKKYNYYRLTRLSINPLMMGTLKPQRNGPLYSNMVIGALAVDG